MQDINSVHLTGRLTRDAELTFTKDNTALAKFSLAVNRSKKVGEKWEDEASFFDCVLWGKQAEALTQYLLKGKKIFIEGRLQQDTWERDGKTMSRVGVVIEKIDLGDKSSEITEKAPPGTALLNKINKLVEDNRKDLSEPFLENVANWLKSNHGDKAMKEMVDRIDAEILAVAEEGEIPF